MTKSRLRIAKDYYPTNLKIIGNGKVFIEDDTAIAEDVTFITANHDYQGTKIKNGFTGKDDIGDIYVGHNVWIGHGCIILKGIKIFDGAVVGAGSVVTKDVPPYEVWAGNPAKFIKKRKERKE